MTKHKAVRTASRAAAAGAAVAAAGYATLAASTWLRFGRAPRARAGAEQDALLDRFMPAYDIVERHHVMVEAPAAVTLYCARHLDMQQTCLSRAIFKAREVVMGATQVPTPGGGLIDVLRELGWGVLLEQPEHEVILGAVTRPWEPNPVFRRVPSTEFATFCEPGYVKIAVTLRADRITDRQSMFRTETRAVATDAQARRIFRRYWAMVSPGVALIRLAMLKPVKDAAERAAAKRH